MYHIILKRDIYIYRVRQYAPISNRLLKIITNFLLDKKFVKSPKDLLGSLWVGGRLIDQFYNEIYLDINEGLSLFADINS